MATATPVNITKETIIKEAQAEITKELVDKHKSAYKRLLREREAARQVLANIDRQIEDLELKMDQELNA